MYLIPFLFTGWGECNCTTPSFFSFKPQTHLFRFAIFLLNMGIEIFVPEDNSIYIFEIKGYLLMEGSLDVASNFTSCKEYWQA